MRRLVRFAVVTALAAWAWRRFVSRRGPSEYATVAFAGGSALVLEPGSDQFARLASAARRALRA